MRSQGFSRQGYASNEQAKPILGTQPPPPGTVPVRDVEAENEEPEKELVSTSNYYQEGDYEWREFREEIVDIYGHP